MPDVMKTLLLNPPSFENFDGGASSRWAPTREIESDLYPVWLTYPARMISRSPLLHASPPKINWQQTVPIFKDYEFLILFPSPVGFATDIYKRDLEIERYNVPFLLHPYVSFYTTRGCPALCTFCMWPQTISGHAWRTRSTENVAREVKQALGHFPQMKEIFFDDDTFNIRKDRVLDLCAKFKPLKFRWSSTARVHSDYETVKAMADSGARLFIVGFESGDAQILKNIKKGATLEMARNFRKSCRKVGIRVHGDFIIGLTGETKETDQKTIDFAKELDCETIQVSLAHAMPGTELHDTMAAQGFLKVEALADSGGHQLPHIEYPHLSKVEMMGGVNRFYDEYYFRPKVVWRIVKEALWDSHERKRLYHEATEFLKLRAERLKWARQGGEDYKKPMISVPETPSASAND